MPCLGEGLQGARSEYRAFRVATGCCGLLLGSNWGLRGAVESWGGCGVLWLRGGANCVGCELGL